MKRLIAAAIMMATSIFGQNAPSTSEGPVYDRDGRLTAYVYADGSREQYAYDSAWRMTSFTDRAGNRTMFVYKSDGSMTVLKSDGTQR